MEHVKISLKRPRYPSLDPFKTPLIKRPRCPSAVERRILEKLKKPRYRVKEAIRIPTNSNSRTPVKLMKPKYPLKEPVNIPPEPKISSPEGRGPMSFKRPGCSSMEPMVIRSETELHPKVPDHITKMFKGSMGSRLHPWELPPWGTWSTNYAGAGPIVSSEEREHKSGIVKRERLSEQIALSIQAHKAYSSSSNYRSDADPYNRRKDEHWRYNTDPYNQGKDDWHYDGGYTDPYNQRNDDESSVYQAAVQDLHQPVKEAELPHGLLSVPLLRHQKIALHWMLQRETRSLHCLGGILADDQGLGKTISIISLVQMQRKLETISKSEDNCNEKVEVLKLNQDGDDDSSGRSSDGQRLAGGTLVVCPASVLRQWARELDDKVADESKLDVLIYHGGSRTKDPLELAKYDVVLTTYAIVSIEVPMQPMADEECEREDNQLISQVAYYKKRKKTENAKDFVPGPLARVHWSRVVLDEAHTIKNHRTRIARSCCSLHAKRRWCLSGTPLQNTIEDLYSYFRFLKYEPYDGYISFISSIMARMRRGDGYKKLQVVLKGILLRRTKETLIDGKPILTLPPKSISLKGLEFSKREWDFYNAVEDYVRSKFKAIANAGEVGANYAIILLLLLRLRQACDHPVLVKGSENDEDEDNGLALPDAQFMSLGRKYRSSKIKAVLDILCSHHDANKSCSTGATKSIVFSQWTSMLDLVEDSLTTDVGINFRRLDGRMSLAARDEAVTDFNNDPEVTVMLMSLKAGNVGLNMIAATHVILMDPWWNPTVEDQAIDRAHRIGQTRPVTVTRLTVHGTIEDRILALQEQKREMIASAFGEDQTGAFGARLTVKDLKFLFNV